VNDRVSPPPVLLHRFLGIGLVVTGAALIVARRLAADAGPDDVTLFEYVFSALGAAMAGVALLFLKRQVPERRPGQTTPQYWADTQVVSRAQLFWFILQGAGIIAAVGHFLSGGPFTGAVWAFVAATFWMNGPAVFTKD
jgi:hypothetical protein